MSGFWEKAGVIFGGLSLIAAISTISEVRQCIGLEPGVCPLIQAPTVNDAIYVNGVELNSGLPIENVRDKFGNEDERYLDANGSTFYLWKMDGIGVSIETDKGGSVSSISITAARDSNHLNKNTFALLEGKRIAPGKVTLGRVQAEFPYGEWGQPWNGENVEFIDYSVRFGGEGTQVMRFGSSWMGISEGEPAPEYRNLDVTTIEIGFPQDPIPLE